MAEKINSLVLNISGMTCNKCVIKVEQALSEVEGVEKVMVDLSAQKAKIKFSGQVEKEKLVSAVRNAGYQSI